MITLMGNKNIFKPSTFPKRKRKHEQTTAVAKPRNLRCKPSIEALNLLKQQTNPLEGPSSEHDTSLESNIREGQSKENESFTSEISEVRDQGALMGGLPLALPSSLNLSLASRSHQLPILPHINIGQSLTLPSRRHISEYSPPQPLDFSQEATGSQALQQPLSERQFRPIQPPQGLHIAQQNFPQRHEAQYYYPSPQHQQSQSFQPMHQSRAGSYPPPIIPPQQMPGTYPHNPEFYPSYQQPQLPPQPQYVPIHMQNYYQHSMPSLSLVPPQHQIYYNVVPYTMSDPYGGIVGIPRKSKQSSTWSAEEDKLLRELKEVQKLGWREISTFFHERTPNACQFRWRRIISNLDVRSKGASAEASDKEKELNVSSFSETQTAIQDAQESQKPPPTSQHRDSPDDDDVDEANTNKKGHNQSNKIDFLLN